jgi:putative nucleotidyltransferase with HDIG domain
MSISLLEQKEIRYQISQIKELPPLPQSLQRLIDIIHEDVASPEELVSIIRYDQSLAAKVLRIANSTYYGRRGDIRSLAKAVMIIGFNHARSICMCTLLMSFFSGGNGIGAAQRESLWKHAFATSRIAAEIAKKRPWVNTEEAAVLGLVHDIGRLAMAVHFREEFKSITEIASMRKARSWCVELQYGLSHTQLGKYLALRWAFPEVFAAVIEFHHSPELSQSHKTEVRLIYLANILSHAREFPEMLEDEVTLSNCRELYISEEEWQEYQEGLGPIWSDVDQLWNLLG